MKHLRITNMFSVLSSSILLSFFTGCSTTSGLAPAAGYSGFDNARTVDIVPHATAPNSVWDVITTSIGAQWNAAQAEQVILVIKVRGTGYTGITGAELNIGGEKVALTPTAYVTDMEPSPLEGFKDSTKPFVTDLNTVEKIIRSKRTWLRVQTSTGTVENMVADGEKNSKAYYALIRFMDAVKAK